MRITKAQRRVLEAIDSLTRENGYPPTMREIMERCGLKNVSTIYHHIDNLLEKGVLEKDRYKSRTVRIKEEAK